MGPERAASLKSVSWGAIQRGSGEFPLRFVGAVLANFEPERCATRDMNNAPVLRAAIVLYRG